MSQTYPQHFGKYILMRKIAMGGMAEIFKGKVAGAEGFEKDIVIKRILPHFTEDESFVKMFIDEASITSKLQHPNIVQIFDFDVVDGMYYIAMEYIPGMDLKDVIEECKAQGQKLTVPQVVWIMMEVSKGLHYAHVKEHKGQPLNIVHRDVTPSNVMMAYSGEVKLMDFGIAKAAQRSTKTMAGAVKGKVAYMSPEQARGKPLDGRSDLFALGTAMWEMLTGKRLFLAESDFETLTNVLKAEVPPPSSINPDVPPELDPIVLSCLAKDREERYDDVEVFNRHLTRWYYSNVIDLEKEKLKPLMHRVFKEQLDEIERADEEDRASMAGGLPAQTSEATVSMPSSDAVAGPISEQKTRMDVNAMGGGGGFGTQPSGPASSEAATRAMQIPGAFQGTATQQQQWVAQTGTHQRPARGGGGSKLWLWLILLLLVLGGGGAALFVALSGGEPDKPPPPPTVTATLTIQVTPHAAKVTVNGDPVSNGSIEGLELDSNARVVGEAPGYKRYEEIVKITDENQVHKFELEEEGEKHRFVIKPPVDGSSVYVDGSLEGTGAVPYEGLVGKEIVIKVVPPGGKAVEKTVTITKDLGVVSISAKAELVVFVEPSSATITSDAGTVTAREAGVWAISDVELGTSVTITGTASSHKSASQQVTLDKPTQNVNLTLTKIISGGGGGGIGSIRVAARPWANVAVDGRPKGRTPTTIKGVRSGRRKVTFSKGPQTVTKTVKVKAGETVFVQHNW